MYKYTIGSKTYVQKPLVLGQIRQLAKYLRGLSLPKSRNVFEIVETLGDQLPIAFAIVLTEENGSVKDKDLEKIAEEIDFLIDWETTVKVIEDFFACTPIFSIMARIGEALKKTGVEIQLKTLQSSSPAETSPNETQSSGDSLQPSVSDLQNNAPEI